MKKILHISKFHEPHKGGIEDVCRTIVNVINDNDGYEQIILCFSDNNKDAEDIVDGVKVYRAAVPLEIASQPISISFLFILRRLLRDHKPDFIHYHAPNPFVALLLLLCKGRNSKLIVHWHSDVVAQKTIYKLIKPIESRLLRSSYKIIATSPNYITDSAPLQQHIEKVSVLPNVIDCNKFKLTEQIKERVIKIKKQYKNRPIVLFVGRHVPYKGLYYLIEAIKHIKSDAIYLIGGTGPLSEELKSQSAGVQNIHFIGRIPNDDLVAMYYAADVFAFPSITKNEAFGVVLAEAMYCNTPAVTFTIKGSGVNWVNIHNETGFEVANSDILAFAGALESLISDKELKETLGTNARQRVIDLYTIDKIKQQIIDIYN